jgi:hypothetical protein
LKYRLFVHNIFYVIFGLVREVFGSILDVIFEALMSNLTDLGLHVVENEGDCVGCSIVIGDGKKTFSHLLLPRSASGNI